MQWKAPNETNGVITLYEVSQDFYNGAVPIVGLNSKCESIEHRNSKCQYICPAEIQHNNSCDVPWQHGRHDSEVHQQRHAYAWHILGPGKLLHLHVLPWQTILATVCL